MFDLRILILNRMPVDQIQYSKNSVMIDMNIGKFGI